MSARVTRVLLAALVALLGGCATGQRVLLRPAGGAPGGYDEAPLVDYRFGTDEKTGVRVQLVSPGIAVADGKQGRRVHADFEFRVRNATAKDVLLDVAAFRLKDDEGALSGPPILAGLGKTPEAPVLIAPEEKGELAVSFDITGRTDPSRVGSVVLTWNIRIGDAEPEAVETKFLRLEVRDRPIPYPYYYRYGGLYRPWYRHGGHASAWVVVPIGPYDPFFDDPWLWPGMY